MQKLLVLIALSLSLSAHAIEVYNCNFSSSEKGSAYGPHLIKTFLSREFSNQVTSGTTVLDLSLSATGKISGTVNGQPNFILSGTPAEGHFESAYHTGTIHCDAPVQVAYLLQFKPWKQYYTLDKALSADHIQNSADLSSVYYGNLCFIGNAQSAANAIAAQAEVLKIKVIDAYRMDLTFKHTSCVQGTGNNQDDYTCDLYKTETVTKPLMNCTGDGWVDPRS